MRLSGKRNSNPHGARPVHLIVTMMTWIRTSALSFKNSLSGETIAQSREEAALDVKEAFFALRSKRSK